MINWTRAKYDYPRIKDEPVYVKTMSDEIRIMVLILKEDFNYHVYSPMLFSSAKIYEDARYWKDINSDYTCNYDHVINWAYVKDNPGQENFIRYKGP